MTTAHSFIDHVPKDPVDNLRWRIRWGRAAINDKEVQHAFYDAAMEDVLFFFNAFCIAEGTTVVTDRGSVPIEEVTPNDLVWDGDSWVSQGGALIQGRKPCIFAYGIQLTPNHKVWTNHGWQDASCGYDRAAIRLPEGYSESWELPEHETSGVALQMSLRQHHGGLRKQFTERLDEELRVPDRWQGAARSISGADSLYMVGDAPTMQQPSQLFLCALRRAWDSGLRAMGHLRELFGGHGRAPRRFDYRTYRQRQRLRTDQLPMGHSSGAGGQQASPATPDFSYIAGSLNHSSTCPKDGYYDGRHEIPRSPGGTRGRTHAPEASPAAPLLVYDLLNCGPKRAFTILDNQGRPLLVHNCWLFEPRALVKEIPFCTWPHQDPCILTMDQAITDSERRQEPIDVVVDKSRGQGATWMYLMVFLRRWLRDPMFSAGLVTRNEKLVDSTRDPDTLMWKFHWALEQLPPWMIRPSPIGYTRLISDHIIMNNANGATICGYSATGDVARGGRKTTFALDELGAADWIRAENDYSAMDSTQHVTNCRLLVSTYGADRGAFFEAATEDTDAIKVILDWHNNPIQNRLAYQLQSNGKVVAERADEQAEVEKYIKKNKRRFQKLERRGHTMENKIRSPWYDSECSRPNATPRSVAKELDRNPRGAVGKVFDVDVLDRMTEECCQTPLWQGRLVADSQTATVGGLIRQENGPLKLWFLPGLDNMVPYGSYVVGCDISAGGTGEYSSNSVACGINAASGEQVFEYTIKGLAPTKFARVCVALARWFRNACLGWEATGPGHQFEPEVAELAYYNIYYRPPPLLELGNPKYQRKPGWWNGRDEDKGLLFEHFCIGMDEGKMTPRSEQMVKECGEYEWADGKIVHAPTKAQRGGATGKAHGDRCIAGGVAWLLCRDRAKIGLDRSEPLAENAEYGSFAWREEQERARQRKFTDEDSPQPTLIDILRD